MNKFKMFWLIFLLSLVSMVSIAATPDRVKVVIVNNSEMSMQTTISSMSLDSTGTECVPSMAQYNIAVIAPRTYKSGVVGWGNANLCQLGVSTFTNGDTCFVRISPVPSILEIIVPNELGAGICNRITYKTQ
jgi:anaerobic C4-dicarboxylate transporter